ELHVSHLQFHRERTHDALDGNHQPVLALAPHHHSRQAAEGPARNQHPLACRKVRMRLGFACADYALQVFHLLVRNWYRYSTRRNQLDDSESADRTQPFTRRYANEYIIREERQVHRSAAPVPAMYGAVEGKKAGDFPLAELVCHRLFMATIGIGGVPLRRCGIVLVRLNRRGLMCCDDLRRRDMAPPSKPHCGKLLTSGCCSFAGWRPADRGQW